MDTPQPQPQQPVFNPVPPPRQMPRWPLIAFGVLVVVVAGAYLYWHWAQVSSLANLPTPTFTAEPTNLPTPSNQTGTPLPSPIAYHNSVKFTDHTPYARLDLFDENTQPSPDGVLSASYDKIGEFVAGPYIGADLVRATTQYDGPGGPLITRFAVKNDAATLLERHSQDIWQDPQATTPEKFKRDGAYVIAELIYSESFTSPDGKDTFIRDPYVFNDWDADIGTRQLQKVFTLAGYGDVYTDVTSATPTPTPLRPDNVISTAEYGFYLKAPDGSIRKYELAIPFAPVRTDRYIRNYLVNVTWADGKANTKEYQWVDVGGCGWTDYAAVMKPYEVNVNDLTFGGTAQGGSEILVFKDANNSYLKKFYDNNYYGTYGPNSGEPVKVSYAEFVASHPMFFWRDDFGRLIKFTNNDFMPQAECGKPVIYLYPPTTQKVFVQVSPRGGLTYSEPDYSQGWTVTARPDGRLTDGNGAAWPYLFWEGRGGIYEQPSLGWSVAKGEVESFLDAKLSAFGLNAKEIADFKEFWLPRMQSAPYYFITFLGTRQMDEIAPLTIQPRPDSVLRVLMDFSPLQQPEQVESFTIPHFIRQGFSVVEWGGVLK